MDGLRQEGLYVVGERVEWRLVGGRVLGGRQRQVLAAAAAVHRAGPQARVGGGRGRGGVWRLGCAGACGVPAAAVLQLRLVLRPRLPVPRQAVRGEG